MPRRLRSIDLPMAFSGGVAGLAGIGVWLVVQRVDIALTGNDYDDVKLLGMAVLRGRAWKPVGLLAHSFNGALFGLAYAGLAEPRLAGPGWLRGLIAAQVENATLSTLTPLVDRWHPAVRDGRLAPTATPVSLAQAVLRHAAFGLTLGIVYEWLMRGAEESSMLYRRTHLPSNAIAAPSQES